MNAPVFVDTNILVYARDASEPAKQEIAARWLSDAWQARTGRISTQVLSEYYVTVTRKLRPGLPAVDAWDDVAAFMAWRPQALDVGVLERGREVESRYRLGWWDSLIVAAAQIQGCALLLSEDLQDGAQYGTVAVRNPFRIAAGESIARCGAAYLPAHSPHPRRGRPAAR